MKFTAIRERGERRLRQGGLKCESWAEGEKTRKGLLGKCAHKSSVDETRTFQFMSARRLFMMIKILAREQRKTTFPREGETRKRETSED